jgi:protein-disulfide isomerase
VVETATIACQKGRRKGGQGVGIVNGKQLVFGIVTVAAVGLCLAAYFIVWGGSGDSDAGGEVPKYTITLASTDHMLGSPNAPVQVVEYAAPVCPICARWDMTVFQGFKSSYIDTGKVHYIFRVYPLQPVDLAVESMANCLPKSGYFPFIDMMYRNQSQWDPDGYQIPDQQAALVHMGKIAGMTEAQVNRCSTDQAALKKASDVGGYAQKTYNINSTPSFIIDGVFHQQDVMTPEGVHAVIDAELKNRQS